MMFRNEEEMQHALLELLKKYHIRQDGVYNLFPGSKANGLKLWPGWAFIDAPPSENQVPLLTWRVRRKFVELKKIVQEVTVENPRMFRFNSTGDRRGWSLKGLLYREFDLCEFISGSTVTSLQAVFTPGWAGNVIARLKSGILCSIEVSTLLSGPDMIDRHEIIAQRGVASDIVVDTMIPQSSIYTYTESGENRYRDVDEELFGFDEPETDMIRSAFQVLKQPDTVRQWKVQHLHLTGLVNAAFTSDKERRKITF